MPHRDKNKKERIGRRAARRRTMQKMVSVLAAFVVFITTYALVLPAVTIDQETAGAEPGLEVSYVNEKEGVLGAMSAEDPSEAPDAADDSSENAAVEPQYPAAEEEGAAAETVEIQEETVQEPVPEEAAVR